jgi:hypothetical protein
MSSKHIEGCDLLGLVALRSALKMGEVAHAFVKVVPVSQTRVCTLRDIRRASDVVFRIRICLMRGSFAARHFEHVGGPTFTLHSCAVNCPVSVTELKRSCGARFYACVAVRSCISCIETQREMFGCNPPLIFDMPFRDESSNVSYRCTVM